MNNSLELSSINELLGRQFFIPSYQRGYRWTERQVTELLEDIWDFELNPPKSEDDRHKPFYCLQPLVIKPVGNNEWEVIDGQQRLTTIYLILKALENIIDGSYKNFGKIEYETRAESENYLKNIVESEKDANVDYYHIYNASVTINNWFASKADAGFSNARVKFLTPFLEKTKVIWYQVNDDTKAIDIFTRINIGKIPLTNAELIKALFLRQSNFAQGGQDNVRLKQLQIASEWDKIESVLQHDAFWYFIREGNQKYATRIEYIFDLMKGKNSSHDAHYTFYEFHQDYLTDKNIDRLWLEVKQHFQTFEEWYNDRELYHLIGFLIATGHSVTTLLHESRQFSKSDFKEDLKAKIRKSFQLSSDAITELEYSDRKVVRPLLLLFNIQTILNNKASNLRFPFDRYKKEDWDIEHIRSVKSDIPKGSSKQRRWLEAVLEYYTGTEDPQEQEKTFAKLEDDDQRLAVSIHACLAQDKITDAEFEDLYDRALVLFKEDNEPEGINSISNLALLDANTNRSYKNAVFPVKRRTILENDMRGTFIPLCTRNTFLKAYSSKLDGVMFWQKKDADDYLQAITSTLKPFLISQN